MEFDVTSEDESKTEKYTLTVGRQDGFAVHFQCKTKSGGSPGSAFTASADAGKMSGLSVKDCSNLFLKKDLTGKNELTVKITGISNPLTKITLKKENSVPEDPGETVLASGEKDLKGYTFTVPMVQQSTLTFYFDDTLSFSGADGTVTIPMTASYPEIKIKLVDGELEMQHSSSTGGFSGSVDFTANPVLDMITKFNATTNHGNIFTSDADDLTITEIHLPTAVKTLSNPDGNGETFRSMRALQKVYFPKGFEGDLFSKLGIFVFRYSRKLEEFIFDESPRYIMDSYGNLLERLKDGNGNYSSQCQIIQGLKQKAGTITVNQSGGSVSIPREKAAVIKNGSSYTITKIRSEAFFEDSEHLAYIIIDCPTLEHIEKGNFMLFYAPPTAMYINACTPGAHQFKKEDFVPFWTSNDMSNFMMYVNTNDDAVLSKYKSWGSDETESSPGGATMNTIRPAHIIKQLFTINYP